MSERNLADAIAKLDEFIEILPKMDQPPFEEIIELAMRAEYPKEWIGLLNGQMVGVDMKLMILSLGMRQSSMRVTGDSITISEDYGPGAGNIIETGPCPWYLVIEPLNKWLENHPDWMPINP